MELLIENGRRAAPPAIRKDAVAPATGSSGATATAWSVAHAPSCHREKGQGLTLLWGSAGVAAVAMKMSQHSMT